MKMTIVTAKYQYAFAPNEWNEEQWLVLHESWESASRLVYGQLNRNGQCRPIEITKSRPTAYLQVVGDPLKAHLYQITIAQSAEESEEVMVKTYYVYGNSDAEAENALLEIVAKKENMVVQEIVKTDVLHLINTSTVHLY